MPTEPTLAELAELSRLQPRTIRSWVTQGLLPGPLSRGPTARYPADTPERLLAIRTMRDRLHMPLDAIRQRLMLASATELQALAAASVDAAAEQPDASRPASGSALDYIRQLRAKAGPDPTPAAPATLPAPPPAPALRPPKGFEALERSLGHDRAPAARKAHAEEWLRIPITPEIELAARGPLDPIARARLERCADLIRDILLGRD